MRWIWGGILLTLVVSVNQNLVWAGGNGVERGPISWGAHGRILSDEAKEAVGEELQKACPGAFANLEPEKPVVVSAMTPVSPESASDANPTQQFFVELKRGTQEGTKTHDLAVIVETRRNLAKRHQVLVLTMGSDDSGCKEEKK